MLNLRRAVAGLAAASAILAAAPAVRADTPAPNAHSVELARKLFTEMHMEQLMDNMMRQLGPAMIAQAQKSNPSLSAQDVKVITDAAAEASAAMMRKVVERAIPLYAATFTEKELQDLVDFYDTASGQAMLAKMPVLMSKMGPMVTELVPEMTAEMTRRVCAKVDCSQHPAPATPKT